ncbi:hypothetical protein EV368DRAFT_67186 [Lentinula lateritia]|nr:hypothetical protein EV368DRAFT_67186 [Lentinula lateritia]
MKFSFPNLQIRSAYHEPEHEPEPGDTDRKVTAIRNPFCRLLANQNTGYLYSTVMPIVGPHRSRSEDVDIAGYGQTSDGPGWIYVYIDNGNEFKIGMTKNFERRQREWDRNCPCLNRIWFKPVPAANRRRAESVAHILLEIQLPGACREICFRWSLQGYSEKDHGANVAEGSGLLKLTIDQEEMLVSIDLNSFHSALQTGGPRNLFKPEAQAVLQFCSYGQRPKKRRTHDGLKCSMKAISIIIIGTLFARNE